MNTDPNAMYAAGWLLGLFFGIMLGFLPGVLVGIRMIRRDKRSVND